MIKRLQQQLGVPGMLGIALLASAGTFHNLLLSPLEKNVALLEAQFEDKPHKKPKISIEKQQRQQVADRLPSQQEVSGILANIHKLAELTGVSYQQAEYRLEKQPEYEYRVILPVQGGYKNIRYFVTCVLGELPAVSLDQISFSRKEINNPVWQADIRFTIFLREASSFSSSTGVLANGTH